MKTSGTSAVLGLLGITLWRHDKHADPLLARLEARVAFL